MQRLMTSVKTSNMSSLGSMYLRTMGTIGIIGGGLYEYNTTQTKYKMCGEKPCNMELAFRTYGGSLEGFMYAILSPITVPYYVKNKLNNKCYKMPTV